MSDNLKNDKHTDAESVKRSDLLVCPDLTFIWNRAAQLANQKKISVYRMNEIWGALRTLERQGACKLSESTYD